MPSNTVKYACFKGKTSCFTGYKPIIENNEVKLKISIKIKSVHIRLVKNNIWSSSSNGRYFTSTALFIAIKAILFTPAANSFFILLRIDAGGMFEITAEIGGGREPELVSGLLDRLLRMNEK